MVINKTKEQSKLTVSVSGSLDTVSAPELQNELDLSDVKELVFDFEKLEYISSSGLRILLACQKTMNEQGSMKICHPCAIVCEVFEVTGLDQIFDIEK